MNSCVNRLFELPPQVYLDIICFLDAKSFCSLRLSCKIGMNIMDSPSLMRAYIKKSPIFLSLNMEPLPEDIGKFFQQIFPLVGWYPLLIPNLCSGKEKPLDIDPIEASTTDGNQFIHFTRSFDSVAFWGSLGTFDEDKSEYLLYKLSPELAIPTFVVVEFIYFKYVHQNGMTIAEPVYPSKYVQVEFSMIPDVPIYTTEAIQIKDKVKDRVVMIPVSPRVLAARYMKVNLIGMQSRHTLKDNKYYICVNAVKCFGYSTHEKKGMQCSDFSNLVQRSVQNYYKKLTQKTALSTPEKSMLEEEEKSKSSTLSKDLFDAGYDLKVYNHNLIEKIKYYDLDKVMEIIEENLQLLDSVEFYDFLNENQELALGYFKRRALKQNYVSFQEVRVYLQLVLDFSQISKSSLKSVQKAPYREENKQLLSVFDTFVFKKNDLKEFLIAKFNLEDDPAEDYISEMNEDNDSLPKICGFPKLILMVKSILEIYPSRKEKLSETLP